MAAQTPNAAAATPAEIEQSARKVLARCAARQLTLVGAESCTGGLVMGALTAAPGASAVVDRGFVTYSNAAKTELLHVPGDLIAAHGAVSEPVARAMADGAQRATGAAVAFAVTGVAGPGGSDAKPEGRVHFAVALSDPALGAQSLIHRREDFGPIGRAAVRRASVARALELVLEALA